MSTDLHKRMLAFGYGDTERAELMERVWREVPWMVDIYSGGYSNGRDRELDIQHWCYEQFGEQHSAIHERPGRWYRGGATVHGWTWFGFSTEAEMQSFIDRWPTPAEIEVPA